MHFYNPPHVIKKTLHNLFFQFLEVSNISALKEFDYENVQKKTLEFYPCPNFTFNFILVKKGLQSTLVTQISPCRDLKR